MNHHSCTIFESYCFVLLQLYKPFRVQNYKIYTYKKKMVKTFENNDCALLFDYLKFTEMRFQMLPKFSSHPRCN